MTVRLAAPPARAVTLDTLTEGVHFPVGTALVDVGYKTLAVNLSDLAAMGAQPVHARLHVDGPTQVVSEAGLAELRAGIAQAADDASVPLAAARRPLSLTTSCRQADLLSLSLQATGTVAPAMALRRDGASAGDAVFVSGALGEAAAGLETVRDGLALPDDHRLACLQRLNRPLARVQLGLALAGLASAAIDLSDGLLADLGHLLLASRLDATLHVDTVPLGPALGSLPRSRALALGLGGGDDYELCFTVPRHRRHLLAVIARRTGVDLTEIGTLGTPRAALPGGVVRLFDAAGHPVAAPPGFAHFGAARALHCDP